MTRTSPAPVLWVLAIAISGTARDICLAVAGHELGLADRIVLRVPPVVLTRPSAGLAVRACCDAAFAFGHGARLATHTCYVDGTRMEGGTLCLISPLPSLAAALGVQQRRSLLQAGIDVHVYEQARELREGGAGIQVSPNASRALHRFGLADKLAHLGALKASMIQTPRGQRGKLIHRSRTRTRLARQRP
jgi:hypothetical protein